MDEGTKTILQEMVRLVTLSQEVQGSMNEISVGTEEINRAISAISQLSAGNRVAVESVRQQTAKFKLE